MSKPVTGYPPSGRRNAGRFERFACGLAEFVSRGTAEKSPACAGAQTSRSRQKKNRPLRPCTALAPSDLGHATARGMCSAFRGVCVRGCARPASTGIERTGERQGFKENRRRRALNAVRVVLRYASCHTRGCGAKPMLRQVAEIQACLGQEPLSSHYVCTQAVKPHAVVGRD